MTSIKGVNILVDNKGCIKLADFGASKKVVKLATISEAKSMKGTHCWMAPEVIRQTGHNWQADIWCVGCTLIEMATGKPPWSQQFQEVAASFHIGTTKSHPPIPEHLSHQGKDFLLKCLQREPTLRPSATELLKHPFVLTCENQGGLDDSEDIQYHAAADGHLHSSRQIGGKHRIAICERYMETDWPGQLEANWGAWQGFLLFFQRLPILGEEF
jgi:serine/threonine protein kinase